MAAIPSSEARLGAPPLLETCKKLAIKIITRTKYARSLDRSRNPSKNSSSNRSKLEIDDFGSLPFRLAKPLLAKVQTAEQLYRIEQNSPLYIGETKCFWIDLIKRDVADASSDSIPEPKNPASWYKVYKKLVRESDKRVDDDAQILQAALKGLEEKKMERTSIVVDPRTVPKLPRMHGMRVDKTGLRRVPEKPSDLRFTSGSKTKMVTGKDVLERARQEARERSNLIGKNAVLARPSHMLGSGASRVRQAPPGLTEAHRRPQDRQSPAAPGPKVIAPRRPMGNAAAAATAVKRDPTTPHKYTPEEREARLKAIKSGKSLSPSSTTTASTTAMKPTTTRPPRRLESSPAPHAPSSTSSSPPSKRKRDLAPEQESIDDLFDDTPVAKKAKASSPAPHPPSRSGTSTPVQGTTADGRPIVRVKKPPVDIFMRRPHHRVR